MAYPIYSEDVKNTTKYSASLPPNTTFEEECARTGARRMGWAMANAWREENGLKLWDDLPDWMRKVLEEEGPD